MSHDACGCQERGNHRQYGDKAEQRKRELTARVGRNQVQRFSGIAVVGREEPTEGGGDSRNEQDDGRDSALDAPEVTDFADAG